jgi:retron-type reverse transcriptase
MEWISRETGVNPSVIAEIIDTASRRYKTYEILKRNGGLRKISHPTPAVKFLQRWVVRNFISRLPVHPNVFSYRRGVGISKNAEVHVAQSYLLKMDFENFFPSIRGEDVKRLILSNVARPPFVDLSSEDIEIIVKLVCRNGELTIGAPSSPAISNAILYNFDEAVLRESVQREISYSRYAADIVFSTNVPNVLVEMKGIVEKLVKEQKFPRLSINDEKTSFTSMKRRRAVTGLILTSEKKISVGRAKKREIKALCHLFRNGGLPVDGVAYLRGYLSFVYSVEPSFIASLRQKFGDEIMNRILDSKLVSLK